MKNYRIYVYNRQDGVYHYQGVREGKLKDVLERCKELYGSYGGYIKNYADNRILRNF